LAKFDPHPNEDQQFKLPKSLESGSACRRDFRHEFLPPEQIDYSLSTRAPGLARQLVGSAIARTASGKANAKEDEKA
jgi:hypothetical protein